VTLSQEDLFKLALNLQEPWYIKSIEFSSAKKQIDIHIDFIPGSRFECSNCKSQNNCIHDTKERVWRHLNFFQFKAYIHARVPRTICQKCGSIRLIDVPWARRSTGFTLLMDALILLLAQNMTVSAVAEIIGEHDTRIWRVLSYYIPESRSKEDYSQVKIVGVDETSCAKFHKYVSLFVDLDNSKVLYVCEGKDASTIGSFKKDLEDHNGASKNIEMFCSDMSPAFISGITEQFPGSSLTFDKFHVMKMVNEAVDQVRREEQHHNAELKNTRYMWLKNPNDLSLAEKEKLGSLKDMNLITSKAYNFKLSLKDFWTFNDKNLAEDFLKKWYYWATHSQIEPIIDAAKTIKSHWKGIINYAETKISNGVLEGINSMVQSAKSSARGFRTTKNLMLIIYLRLGKLQFNLPT
jgi:transposase